MIIGVHSPETKGEAKVQSVAKAAKESRLTFPIAIDNDFKVWNAWENEFWPAIYLIDKRGVVRYGWPGELKFGGVDGEELMRKKIDQLLAEPGPKPKDAQTKNDSKKNAKNGDAEAGK